MSTESPQQLLLGVALSDDATFDNFFTGKSNSQLRQFLQSQMTLLQEQLLFIWGSTSCGKTHLQQAMCHELASIGRSSIYIPMRDFHELTPDVLEGLENLDLVCLDDIEVVLGNPAWERALFTFYNRARETRTAIMITSSVAPQQLQVSLPDLKSRLQSGVIFQLHSLNDAEKATMLIMRAQGVGIKLSNAVAEFILLRSGRDVVELLNVLSRLDRQSMEQKRRVTIPLVKQAMGW